ncbi:MAG: putative polymerase ECF-subfamily sigma factor [Thermoleophilia bacterium]|nr:putative polymerase ECF-subfamily sigma factor [Thermoleophilia bacterium]
MAIPGMTHLMARASEPPPPTNRFAWVDAHDEAEVVRRVALGEVPAQERLWRMHLDAVHRVCASQLAATDAEDAVADTFLAAFASAGSFDPSRGSVQAWLLGIAVNQVRRRWRADRRVAATLARVVHRDRATASSPDHAELVIARIDARSLAAGLAELSDADRLVLVVQAAGDLDTQELATALGIARSAAKVRLHRARRRLATFLDPTSPH